MPRSVRNVSSSFWNILTCSRSLPSVSNQQEQGANNAGGNNENDGNNENNENDGNNNNNTVRSSLFRILTCSRSLPSTSGQQEQEGGNNENDGNNENNENDGNNETGENDGNNETGENEDDREEKDYDREDPLMWSRNLEKHSCGEFSYAAVKARDEMKEYSQVDIGSNAIFVGIYDGRVGPHASRFICRHLMMNLIASIKEENTVTEEGLKKAFLTTDEKFLEHARRAEVLFPEIIVNASSCLVFVIWKEKIFIAHVGTSRAVYCRIQEDNSVALQMTLEHNVNLLWVRQEVLESAHDTEILDLDDHGIWRIKGVTPISRSIGDAYLKRRSFELDPPIREFKLSSDLVEASISAEPFTISRPIEESDGYFILAEQEFWCLLSNTTVMEIINSTPRNGIAKRLLNAALDEACRIAEVSYNELISLSKRDRRSIHYDMTVVVVFIDHDLVDVKDSNLELKSFKGFTDDAKMSSFRFVDELM